MGEERIAILCGLIKDFTTDDPYLTLIHLFTLTFKGINFWVIYTIIIILYPVLLSSYVTLYYAPLLPSVYNCYCRNPTLLCPKNVISQVLYRSLQP